MASPVLTLLREHTGDEKYHPLCSLLDLASESDATIPDQINIHKTIAKYCEAERKSIEMDLIGDEPINFRFLIGTDSSNA